MIGCRGGTGSINPTPALPAHPPARRGRRPHLRDRVPRSRRPGDGRPAGGTAQEFTIVPAERVFPLPAAGDFELGASVGIPGITAHRALTVAEDGPARLRPGALDGRTVLVAGGAGAVGNAAIQLARWAGARVIATVSGEAKGRLATAAGARHVVNYREADAAGAIRRIAPDGVDLVVEVAAGANAELDHAATAPSGSASRPAYRCIATASRTRRPRTPPSRPARPERC
jgi:NADPH:quinone reductase-like Zn-dependent oxidoreductase